jgi:uncharacterized protein
MKRSKWNRNRNVVRAFQPDMPGAPGEILTYTCAARFAMAPTLAAVVLVLVLCSPAHAQYFEQFQGSAGPAQNIEGFTVTGKGRVAAKPDKLEIEMDISASSELTADAVVKYRDARKRLNDAFAALKLANITVQERGLMVDQKGQMQNPYFFDYQPTRGKTEIQLSRKLILKASGIRQMDEEAVLQLVGRLLDVAQDTGAKVGGRSNEDYPYYYYRMYGPPAVGLCHFVLDDFNKLEEQAYEQAIADAKARAERLARLSKVQLGPIVSVREIVIPGENRPVNDDDTPGKRLETPKFQEIPVRVELLVRFAVHPPSDGKGRGAQAP